MNVPQESAGYNEAKTEILDAVLNMGEATSHMVALSTNKRYENASVLMLQYFRHGLLHRSRLPGSKAYVYSVSDRGIERLNWLKPGESEEESEIVEDEEDSEEKSEIEDYEVPYN